MEQYFLYMKQTQQSQYDVDNASTDDDYSLLSRSRSGVSSHSPYEQAYLSAEFDRRPSTAKSLPNINSLNIPPPLISPTSSSSSAKKDKKSRFSAIKRVFSSNSADDDKNVFMAPPDRIARDEHVLAQLASVGFISQQHTKVHRRQLPDEFPFVQIDEAHRFKPPLPQSTSAPSVLIHPFSKPRPRISAPSVSLSPPVTLSPPRPRRSRPVKHSPTPSYGLPEDFTQSGLYETTQSEKELIASLLGQPPPSRPSSSASSSIRSRQSSLGDSRRAQPDVPTTPSIRSRTSFIDAEEAKRRFSTTPLPQPPDRSPERRPSTASSTHSRPSTASTVASRRHRSEKWQPRLSDTDETERESFLCFD